MAKERVQPFVIPRGELKKYRYLPPEEMAALRPEPKAKREPREPKRGEIFIERAQEIMGNDFFGADAVRDTFGIEITARDMPSIPFSEADLERAKELGQFLILRADTAADGQPLTIQKMDELWVARHRSKALCASREDWKLASEFFTKDVPKFSWALVSKASLPESIGKNYLEQSQCLCKEARDMFQGNQIPAEYAKAIVECEQYAQQFIGKSSDQIFNLLNGSDWQRYAQELGNLKINRLLRQSGAEALYDMLVYFKKTGNKIMEAVFTWTNSRSSDGSLVLVGEFDAAGVGVGSWPPGRRHGSLGVSLSRSS